MLVRGGDDQAGLMLGLRLVHRQRVQDRCDARRIPDLLHSRTYSNPRQEEDDGEQCEESH